MIWKGVAALRRVDAGGSAAKVVGSEPVVSLDSLREDAAAF